MFGVEVRELVGSSGILDDYPTERVMSWSGSLLLRVCMLKTEVVLFCV